MAYRPFPASTSTPFDDLLKICAGQEFVIRGYHYIAVGDAASSRRNGFETLSIPANRKCSATGWEMADVSEHRTYVATLDELLGSDA